MLRKNGDLTSNLLLVVSYLTKKKKEKPSNLFEVLLRDTALKFNPQDYSITLQFPNLGLKVPAENLEESTTVKTVFQPQHTIPIVRKKPIPLVEEDDLDLGPESDPVRVKISLKAYIRLTLHALKYANTKVRRSDWVEVIGLLTGYIADKDTPMACLVITDAFPIGHGTNVNAQIQDPQSTARVYTESRKKNKMILGWYHSHPSYGAWMSKTDYRTQHTYQKLAGKYSQFTSPIALVIDPTEISTKYYGFKIFRLKEDYRTWEEPKFEVMNCSLESVPDIIKTLLPLAEGDLMFLEYDFE